MTGQIRKWPQEQADRGRESGIGDRLSAARARLGWSRELLAVRSGMSWSAISQIESGRRRNLRPATLAGLARALGVSIDYLVHGGRLTPVTLVHRALVYDSEDAFAAVAAPFLAEGLEHGEAMLAVTPESNVERVRDELGADADAVDFRSPSEVYTNPANALATFAEFVGAAIDRGAPWTRVIGEPVWAGRTEPEVARWTRYESLFNLAFAASPVSVVCPYDRRALAPEVVRDAHATHPEIAGPEGADVSVDYVDPGAFVASS